MIQNVLHRIGGIEAYGILSICLFFAVFLGVLIWTFSLKQAHLNTMAELPLEKDSGTEVPADPAGRARLAERAASIEHDDLGMRRARRARPTTETGS